MAKLIPNIFIATPMYGGQCYGRYMDSVLRLTKMIDDREWGYKFRFVANDALISRARSFQVAEFLESECTHLFFIDADIDFEPEDAIKMIEADLDVICGIYPAKVIRWDWVKEAVEGGAPVDTLSSHACQFVYNGGAITLGDDTPVEISDGGTGFMLIKRQVFEILSPITKDFTSTEVNRSYRKKVKLFFDTSVDEDNDQYLSEDYHFCKLWRKAGGKIFAAPWAVLKHIGNYTYG